MRMKNTGLKSREIEKLALWGRVKHVVTLRYARKIGASENVDGDIFLVPYARMACLGCLSDMSKRSK